MTTYIKVILSLMCCLPLQAHEKSIKDLQVKIEAKTKEKDAKGIMDIYDWKYVHFIFKDQEELNWDQLFKTHLNDYTLKVVKWVPLDKIEKSERETLLTIYKVNNREYSWNYKPLGRFDIIWEDKDNEGATFQNFIMVGRNEKLEYVGLAQTVKKEGKSIIK